MSDVKTEAAKLIAEVRVLPEFCNVGWYAMDPTGTWTKYTVEPQVEDADSDTPYWYAADWGDLKHTTEGERLHKFPDLWKHTKFEVTAKDLASYTDLTNTAGEATPQTETNAEGGQQSKVDARHDLLPPRALKLVAECLAFGNNKYPPFPDGTPNWHKIPASDHLNHMLAHANAMQRGDDSEQHEVNMVTRALMFLETVARDEETAGDYWHPEIVNQATEGAQ